MTDHIDRPTLKRWALAIVAQVEPDDTFIIEDNFDGLVEDWHAAAAQNEGRFVSGAEVATFAGIVVPFLLTLFGDVAKDVIKDQAKKAVGALIDKFLSGRAKKDEADQLRETIEAAIAKSKFSKEQKDELRTGFADLFKKVTVSE